MKMAAPEPIELSAKPLKKPVSALKEGTRWRPMMAPFICWGKWLDGALHRSWPPEGTSKVGSSYPMCSLRGWP